MWGAYLFAGIATAYCIFVLWFLLPRKPRHTVESVAKKLHDGLLDGSIVLSNGDKNGTKTADPSANHL